MSRAFATVKEESETFNEPDSSLFVFVKHFCSMAFVPGAEKKKNRALSEFTSEQSNYSDCPAASFSVWRLNGCFNDVGDVFIVWASSLHSPLHTFVCVTLCDDFLHLSHIVLLEGHCDKRDTSSSRRKAFQFSHMAGSFNDSGSEHCFCAQIQMLWQKRQHVRQFFYERPLINFAWIYLHYYLTQDKTAN